MWALAGDFWWVGLILTVAVLGTFAEIGYRLGRRQTEDLVARRDQVSIHVASILVLLGLLLAFGFSIVESRFSERKLLVLEEAKAIGTTYLRSTLLPEPHAGRIRELLREYVELRLAQPSAEDLGGAIERSRALHMALWRETEAVAASNPESEIFGRFISSLNDLIDLHGERVSVGLYQRLPPVIFVGFLVISILAISVVGYSGGMGQWRSPYPTFALVLAVSLVLVLIWQLDVPGTSIFEISRVPFEDLRRTIATDVGLSSGDTGP